MRNFQLGFLLTAIFWQIAVLSGEPVVLTPSADSYVKNDAATTNYGTETKFIANNANGVRVSFLRFSLAGVAKPLTSAKLDLTLNIASSGQVFTVYGLTSGTGWAETGLTWNNAPGIVTTYTTRTGTEADFLKTTDFANGGAALASFTSADSGVDTAFNVTSGSLLDFLNAAAGDVTLVISEPGASDTSGVAWNSREATTGQPLLTVSADTPPPPPKHIRVVLIGGQSNADGRAAVSGLPITPIDYQAVQDNVPFYYYTNGTAANSDGTLGTLTTVRTGASQASFGFNFGPEIGMSHDLSRVLEASPGTALALIKYAKGGSSLGTDWKAGGNATTAGDGAYYQIFQQVVTTGLAKLRAAYPDATVKIAAMIWVQGESDIDNGSTAAAYGANLTTFIADMRATFSSSLPFVLSRISANQTVYSAPADPDYPDYLTLRAQQEMVAATVPAAYLIDTDSAAFRMNSDNLHFGPLGQLALGQAFAARLGQLLPLRVTSIRPAADGLHLEWNSLPLATYQVLSSPDLMNWTPRFSGQSGTWTDSGFNPQTAATLYYKIGEP